MIITKEWVDQVCPVHGRTSCDDHHLNNRYGGIKHYESSLGW
jgi:hypothetical protein